MIFYIKSIYFKLLELLEPVLDSFSSRLCFFCRQNLGALICTDCQAETISLKKKSIDYKILDQFFADSDQVFHPKIFYLINFFKETSFLIKKAKYSRPHFARFFTKILAKEIYQNLPSILNDDLREDFMSDFPLSSKKVNLYIACSPMYKNKERERAFNFADLIARDLQLHLSNKLLLDTKKTQLLLQSSDGIQFHLLDKIEYLKNFFIRVKNTRALFDLGLNSRISEIQNSFTLNSQTMIQDEGLNILLIIDDICTTGSTLMELMKLTRNQANFDELIGITLYGRNLQ